MRAIALLAALGISVPASAQLLAAKHHPVAMGHHHLMVEDMAAQKAFWTTLGAETTKLGNNVVMKFPNVLVFLRESEPTGGTDGSVVNHIGLQMPDLRSVVKKMRASGASVITDKVVGGRPDAKVDEDGLAFFEPAQAYLAFIEAPNGTRVELYQNEALPHPIANHHIHFYGTEVDAMKAWYVDMFGAKPGQRAGMEAADLGGVNLTFSPTESKLKGTKGRALDHIGFEVTGLEALCEKLEAKGVTFDRPYQEIPELGLGKCANLSWELKRLQTPWFDDV